MADYTDDEIRENSELAQKFLNKILPLEPKEDGQFSADEFANLGPCQIPCRSQDALFFALRSFDKTEDLCVVPDPTPNGKRIGTQIVVHKKWESFIRRHYEISLEVYKEAGFIIGDPNHDKFISFAEIEKLQAEAIRRHKAEYEGDYPIEEEYDPWEE